MCVGRDVSEKEGEGHGRTLLRVEKPCDCETKHEPQEFAPAQRLRSKCMPTLLLLLFLVSLELGSPFLFGLAPDGVYQATRVTPSTGGLLPHLFTLT